MKNFWKDFWHRPAGAHEVLALAIPLVISMSSWTLMHFIDRLFLLWHSERALAAALPAGMLSFAIESFFLGIAMYVNTFVAQYYGADRPERIGLAVWQGVWLALISLPLMLLMIPVAPFAFALIGHEPEIQREEVIYFQVLAYGGGAMVISAATSAFFTGRGKVKIVAIVDTLSALTNIVLDYLWIFGYGGFPEWGIAGAAWATVVALWLKTIIYVALIFQHKYRQKYGIVSGMRFDRELFARLVKYGFPSGAQMLLEVGAFTGFIMMVGKLGQRELAATGLAFNVNTVAFIPMMGVGVAVATLVGQRLGENRADLATRGAWTAFYLASIYMAVMAFAYFFTPELFLLPHTAGATPAQLLEIEQLRDLVFVLLRFVALYCFFDMMNAVFVGALKGAGDTRFILFTTLFSASLPVIVTKIGLQLGGGLY
ncbi:MAG: MATE family efflux transporter, partial [Planctomycetaceae bacterium]|nr:MATE family efflux transporter [Planctomycetaceae bacterium]